MTDISLQSSLRALLATPGFMSSSGDLLALAEAMQVATNDEVNSVTKKLISAAQTRLSDLARFRNADKTLDALTKVDASTVALGSTRSEGDALVADLNAAGVTLATQETYYLSSESFDKDGKKTSSQISHIATSAEKTTAEGGTLEGTVQANGDETRKVAGTGGAYTIYTLQKSQTVLTATVADAADAALVLDGAIARLLQTAAADVLRIKAYMEYNLQQAPDDRKLRDARKDELKGVDNRLAEMTALNDVQTRRALAQRVEKDAAQQQQLKKGQA